MEEARPPNLRATVVDRAMPDRFREDVLEGLWAPAPSIPAKYLYDERGSALFRRICTLPEYDLTRNERAIFDAHLGEIARAIGPGATVIEPGSAGGEKALTLLGALASPAAFVPIDVSRGPLEQGARMVAERFPAVAVFPVCGDFTLVRTLPPGVPAERRLVFFPGSTIGNLSPGGRSALLETFRSLCGPGGALLLGVDLLKPVERMLSAYSDAQGVTAAFNTNVLERINRELDGTFDLSAFRYEARWNEAEGCVEMGQVSLRDQTVRVAGRALTLRRGQWIRTERSYKFTPEQVRRACEEAGFAAERVWEHRGQFGVFLLRAR